MISIVEEGEVNSINGGIRMSWVDFFRNDNKRGGTLILDSRVLKPMLENLQPLINLFF